MPSEKLASAENLFKGNLASAWNILEGSSGDYTDLGIARRFGGAAAAYSLRDIGAMNGRVVKVRRDVDGDGTDKEEDFSANQVQSGALEDWVNGKLESTLPADVATAAAAYSLRKVKADYSGDAVRIRRSSDDVEVDVAFDSDNKVSASSAITNVAEQGGESGQTTATDLNGFLNEVLTVGIAVEGGNGTDRPDSFTNATNSSFTATVTEIAGGYFPYRTNLNDVIVVSFDIVLTGSASPSLTTSNGIDTVQNRSNSEVISSSGSYTKTLTCDQNGGTATHIRFADSDDGTFAVTNFQVVSHTHQAFVHTWYDQAGSNNAVQETAANQPKIAESGALLADGIDFDGVNDELRTSTNIASSQPVTVMSVTKPDAVNKRIFESITNSVRAFYGGSSQTGMNAGNTLLGSTNEVSTNTEYLQTHLFNTTNSKVFLNNVERISGDAGSNAFAGNFSLGGSSAVFDGTMKEVIVYLSDQSDNRFKIESNINNYYGLYNDANETNGDFDKTFSPTADGTFTPNGKDGFTLAVVSSTVYAGIKLNEDVASGDSIYVSFNCSFDAGSPSPKIVLRNTDSDFFGGGTLMSNEESVVNGFNSFTLTSTNSLASGVVLSEADDNLTYSISDFKVSRIARNGFVETWYDQSGNGNDATQGTAGNQPSIVLNGGINTDGLNFDGSDDVLVSTSFSATQPITTSAVFKSSNTSDSQTVIGGISFNYIIHRAGGAATAGLNAGTLLAPFSSITSKQLMTTLASGTSSTVAQNGVISSTGDAGTNNQTDLGIGSNGNGGTAGSGSAKFDGNIEEVIIFDADKTSDRTEIERDIANFYNITLS